MGVRYYQSETLVRNVLRLISVRNAQSLLDIGAGSPATGCLLARSVRRYLAVEQDSERASALKRAGLDTICGRFPLPIEGQFDLVLSSHSIPELSETTLLAYPSFIRTAWTHVAPGGALLIITFKGGARELAELAALVFGGTNAAPRETGSREYETTLSLLTEFGSPLVARVYSHIVAETAEELAGFISPWIAGSSRIMGADQIVHLQEAVEARYFVSCGLYVLPTEHLFISVERQ